MSLGAPNVVGTFGRATATERSNGRQWYERAHGYAQDIAEMYGTSLDVAAAVLSALSPANKWIRNKEDARNLPGRSLGGVLLPAHSEPPNDGDVVVIDGHAWNVATACRRPVREVPRLDVGKRYARCADVYRRAARELDESPQTVQATTWLVWRRENPARFFPTS